MSISRELLGSWKIVWRSVRLPWSSDKHYIWDSGHNWQKPRHMFICFPSLPQTHTEREGPYDLKIRFANVQSLLVINSPLKMCRACTFKCKCLIGLRAGESNLSTRLRAHTDWHPHYRAAAPTSRAARASCHHTRPRSTHWGWGDVHFLRSQGGFIELHRTPPREGWWQRTWALASSHLVLSGLSHLLASVPSGNHHILAASASSSVMGDQQHLPWGAIRAVNSDNGCGGLSTVPGTE